MPIITFQSKESGELIMFQETVERIFKLIGKKLGPRGVFTPEEIPEAIRKIRAEIDREKELRDAYRKKEDEAFRAGIVEEGEPPVFFAQRAVPFLEMLETARKFNIPVTWGL
jgi:hypothetical protein